MSMLVHAYPNKPLREIIVAVCYYQADYPFYFWTGLWFNNLQRIECIIHWHWISFLRPGAISQNKSQTLHIVALCILQFIVGCGILSWGWIIKAIYNPFKAIVWQHTTCAGWLIAKMVHKTCFTFNFTQCSHLFSVVFKAQYYRRAYL